MSTNPFELTGKRIVITGASSGLGRQIALSVSERGGQCFITGRDWPRLAQTLQALEGVGHLHQTADLTSAPDRQNLVSAMPVMDGLVISSGILFTKPVGFWTEENVQEIMNANFSSTILLVNDLIKNKKINRGASIIFISSIAGNVIAHVGNALYSASKGATNAIVKVLALELAPKKIRVNSIMPGMIRTDLWGAKSFDQEQLQLEERKYPLGFGSASDVSNTAVFLLSDATTWMTGSELLLDGGYTLQ
jgi:NAD(P)-dependent dehydrogenase (short-subunit alcohol dehydrogenase family)